MNVLMIDDDAEDRELFSEALTEEYPDAVCIGVSSCEKIEETIARVNPDIIFMDGHMQPRTGAECLREIHKIIDCKQIKVIIHSGTLSPVELTDLESAGVDHFLLKPSSFEELKSNIRHVLEKFFPCYVQGADPNER